MTQFREERPSRSLPNPTAKTASAREALQSFFCELCDKGYQRISEYENHLSSYEHNHKKRFREMKEMQKVSSNFEKLRKQGHKKKDTEIKPFIENQWHKNMDLNIQPLKLPSNKDSTFKKVGFKKAFHHFNNNLTDSMDSKKTFQSPDSYDSNITKLSSNPLDLIDDEKDLGELYNPHVPTSP